MLNLQRILRVLSLSVVLSLLLVSVGLAAPKQAPAQDAGKTTDKSQTSGAKTPPAQDAGKTTDKSDAVPPVIEAAKAYDNLVKDEPILIIIDKAEYRLYLFIEGMQIKSYDIAVGKNFGQKKCVGDMTTPVGEFMVDEIIPASDWTHDFHDGNGEIAGAYGPWFIALETGWIGIGIHGTHDPSSIRTMASEGCIRMHNDKVAELKELISVGTKVIII